MTEEARKKLELPMKGHDKCPQCGGKERIGREKIAEMVAAGELEEGLFPKGPTWSMPLIDQTKPIMIGPLSITKPKIPILFVYWDVCANPECMGVYVTGVDFVEQEIEIPKMPMGMGSGRMMGLPSGPQGFPFNKG